MFLSLKSWLWFVTFWKSFYIFHNNMKWIYIMTNPSFPNYIKIGYSNDIESRRESLSKTSVPYPFVTYAVYETDKKNSDKKLHALIDVISPKLRVTKNREFYCIEKEKAYRILLSYADSQWNADKVKLLKISKSDQQNEEEIKNYNETESQKRKIPFKFSMIGIKPVDNAVITFFNNDEIKATVISDDTVLYNWKQFSLSSLAQKLLWVNYWVRWPEFFKYDWEILKDRRDRMEKNFTLVKKDCGLNKFKNENSKKENNDITAIREATNQEKKLVKEYLSFYWKKDSVRLGPIMEAFIVSWYSWNYSKNIYPYIVKYYPELTKKWMQNMRGNINATVQRYTKWLTWYNWTEIFKKDKYKWGTYTLIKLK